MRNHARRMLVFRFGLDRLRPVRFRRFAVCLLSLTMLQLGLVRADVCDAHTDVAADVGGSAHHGDHDMPSDPAPQPACDLVTGGVCCTAVASCSIVLNKPESISAAVPTIEQVAVMVALLGAPLSATAAPETPPPRV